MSLFSVHLGLALVACACVGGAVFFVARWLTWALSTSDLEQGSDWRYDVSRVNDLRRVDWVYRYFQPAVQSLARFNRRAFRPNLARIEQDTQIAGLSRSWLGEEYLARLEILALLISPVMFWFFARWTDVIGAAFLAIACVPLSTWFLRRRLAGQARRRLILIKRRLPYLLDLLTLLMEAGATFLQALGQSTKELRGHPAAVEFGRVLTDMDMGKTRGEALEALKTRLRDDDMTSIVGSIIQGEELGTPLATIFRTQADVLRLKRTQRAEAMAGEAGVKMLLPGILVLISTMLIILGPFLLNYLYSGFAF